MGSEIFSEVNPISVIIPAYREAKNIPPLLNEIHAIMISSGLPYETIVIDDDSGDGTFEAVEELREHRVAVTLIVRKERGLSSAVILGVRRASGEIAVVMDADLSHPPRTIPDLVRPIVRNQADFVIGSRFMKGGSSGNLRWYRKLHSLSAKALARPLVRVTDPMSGFFAFKKRLLASPVVLDPIGFKVGLEILVKAAPKRILEVPIHFGERRHGESKLSIREEVNCLIHLKRLYRYRLTAPSLR